MKESTEKILENLFTRYPQLESTRSQVTSALLYLIEMYRNQGKLLVCGNGGSSADSLHIVGELMKDFSKQRPLSDGFYARTAELFPEYSHLYTENLQSPLTAISLVNEIALSTAYSNDRAGELAYAQQVLGYGRADDILLAISTSGNSKNILHAARISKILGLKVISLTGENGGQLLDISDVCICAPSSITYEIQELHLPIYHVLCLALEEEFF